MNRKKIDFIILGFVANFFFVILSFSDRGSTPLYVSAQNGHTDVVKELLNNFPNPHIVFDNNHKRRRPIDIARENGHRDIELILKVNQITKIHLLMSCQGIHG